MVDDLRVLIAADDPLARAGLATLLANQPGLTIVGQVSGRADLATDLASYSPDVVLWDCGWLPAPAVLPAAAADLLADLAGTGTPVVALLPDEEVAAEAWAAGVRGLLLRQLDAEVLLAAITAVASGLAVFAPVLAGAVLPRGDRPPAAPAEELTPREREVLQLLADGLPNKAIALRLKISEHTVKFHVNAIMGKLGAQSRTEAVVRATRLGLIIL